MQGQKAGRHNATNMHKTYDKSEFTEPDRLRRENHFTSQDLKPDFMNI